MASILGTDLADVLNGTAGRDRILGEDGDDTLRGGGGNDTLSGGQGSDLLVGGDGDDRLEGGDVVRGGPGNDWIQWAANFPFVDGGTGRDTLAAGTLNLAVFGDGIRNIEIIDLGAPGLAVLSVTASGVLEVTSAGVLRVEGSGEDLLVKDPGWTRIADIRIGSSTYEQYIQGGATLQVARSIAGPFIHNLLAIDGNNGFRLTEETPGDLLGGAVAGVGDMNGDGFGDVVVNARRADDGDGAAYVVFGAAAGFDAHLPVGALDGANGFRISGDPALFYSGRTLSGGDVNGDGFADLIVGSGGDYGGAAYVIFGSATVGAGGNMALAGLDGVDGSMLSNPSMTANGHFPTAVRDINGDGYDDLVVTVDHYEGEPAESYVVFGRAGGWGADFDLNDLGARAGFRITGDTGFFSRHSASAGDVNGDGYRDLILGAPYYPVYPDGPGAAYVVFGGPRSALRGAVDLGSLDGSNGFRVEGFAPGDRGGLSVSAAGDLNGDGVEDLIIGAPDAGLQGECYVIFGGRSVGAGGTLDLAGLDGETGFRITGESSGGLAGYSLSGAGDLNGDGYDDLVIGGNSANAFVVLGGADIGAGGRLSLHRVDVNVFRIKGSLSDQPAVSAAGDVNGDGYDDLVIGLDHRDKGEAYVLFGRDMTDSADFTGSAGRDRLVGTAAAEAFVAGQGNDVMIGGGGRDVFRGGAGNDIIHAKHAFFLDADGGSGTDMLVLGRGHSLNLTALSNSRTSGIEVIGLHSDGASTLRLTARDLLDLSDTTNTLTVRGDEADTAIVEGGAWTDRGLSGAYHVYQLGAGILRVDADMAIQITIA